MNKPTIKILIIEDDPIWAIKVEAMLDDSIFEIVGVASNITTAISMIEGFNPDIIVSDIMIYGFPIYDTLLSKNLLHLRYVFMSGLSDDFTYIKTSDFYNSSFLVKPFQKNTLISNINAILKIAPLENTKQGEFITFIGKLQKSKKVYLREITYIKAMGNYSAVFTVDSKKYVKKNTLSKIKNELNQQFIQIHKSYMINQEYINRVNLGKDIIIVNNEEIPIGRTYKKNLNSYIEREN